MAEITERNSHANGSFYSIKAYDFHELCLSVPPMTTREKKRMLRSLQTLGQQEDIILLDNKILDGRHLYITCNEAGITPRFRDYDKDIDPKDFVKSRNFHRRQMNTGQLAFSALEDLEIERNNARLRQKETQFSNKTKNRSRKKHRTVGHLGLPTDQNHKKGKAIFLISEEYGIAPKSLRKAEKMKIFSKNNPKINTIINKILNKETSLDAGYREFLGIKRLEENKNRKDSIPKNISQVKEDVVDNFKVTITAAVQESELEELAKTDTAISEIWENVKLGKKSYIEGYALAMKVVAFKGKLRYETNSKVRAAGEKHLKKTIKHVLVSSKNKNEKETKINDKKETIVDEIPIEKTQRTKPDIVKKDKINDVVSTNVSKHESPKNHNNIDQINKTKKFVSKDKPIKPDLKESIIICPHCKMNIIVSGEVVSILPLHLK